MLDHHVTKYENFLLLCDFNSEVSENAMKEFCDTYNLTNLIKEPTCFKNPLNPSSIHLILTNRPRSFQNSKVIQTGSSDHHKLTITVMRAHLLKKAPITVTYRDYKHYNEILFRYVLMEKLNNESNVDCGSFETILTTLLSKFAPLQDKVFESQ